ncbi:GNAT family N-acetyltransferase [Cellulosimicrobium cellulans]|uniref:GNAT family N-acetyltransferase n=1 Tax=Cellulosimicrobium cellulans TaxID=1710 RepID=UPI0024071175|nr:GNAT family N-acetyltransferase [Cellulosimicrobium cellulans]MDF9877534.1 CelD/BcsL family acetyltransferase involved in cellulose biosynthesis [Cellulosimicrobium cellulans]
MTGLRTRTLALAAATPDDVDRWARLVDRALEPNPFLSPAYLATAARHLPEARDVVLVVVEDEERLLAVLPLSRDHSPRSGTTFATTAGPFLGSDSPLCAPLVDRDRPDDTLDALIDHLRSRTNGFPGLVELTLVPVDGPLWDALARACARNHVSVFERYRMDRAVLRRDPDAPTPREALSTSRRKHVDRMRRRLEREVGPLTVTDRGDDPTAFEDFVRLEAAGWKGTTEDGGALAVSPGREEWFREVAARLRERGHLHVLSVDAGDQTVFMSVALGAGSSLYGLMDAYDERFTRCSPGTVGRVLEQEHVLERTDALLFDPCLHPANVVPTGLYRSRRTLAGVVLGTRPAARGLLAVARARHRLRDLRPGRSVEEPGGTGTPPEAPREAEHDGVDA